MTDELDPDERVFYAVFETATGRIDRTGMCKRDWVQYQAPAEGQSAVEVGPEVTDHEWRMTNVDGAWRAERLKTEA